MIQKLSPCWFNSGRRARLALVVLATATGLGAFFASEHSLRPAVSTAEARVGRPLTPMSYAGVARRTTRRAATVGVAAGAAAAGAYAVSPACVRVRNAYGRIVTRCR